MCRWYHSKNAAFTIHSYFTGALLHVKHICWKGHVNVIKEERKDFCSSIGYTTLAIPLQKLVFAQHEICSVLSWIHDLYPRCSLSDFKAWSVILCTTNVNGMGGCANFTHSGKILYHTSTFSAALLYKIECYVRSQLQGLHKFSEQLHLMPFHKSETLVGEMRISISGASMKIHLLIES